MAYFIWENILYDSTVSKFKMNKKFQNIVTKKNMFLLKKILSTVSVTEIFTFKSANSEVVHCDWTFIQLQFRTIKIEF